MLALHWMAEARYGCELWTTNMPRRLPEKRTQPRRQATLTQPLHCDLQRLSCKAQLEPRARTLEIAAPKPDLDAKAKKTIWKHFLKGILKGKSPPPILRKSRDKSLSQHWCSHSNTIYDVQLQKTIALRTSAKWWKMQPPPQCYDPKRAQRHTHTHRMIENAAGATRKQHLTVQNLHRAIGKPLMITFDHDVLQVLQHVMHPWMPWLTTPGDSMAVGKDSASFIVHQQVHSLTVLTDSDQPKVTM